MKFESKLPAKYYRFADRNLNDCDKNKKEKVAFTFSAYQACKLEKFAVKNEELVADLFRRILVEEGILGPDDVVFSGKKKHSSKFIGTDCETLKDMKTHKIYHLSLDECAQVKLYKAMLERGVDVSFWLKSRMVKRENREKDYQIFDVQDLSF